MDSMAIAFPPPNVNLRASCPTAAEEVHLLVVSDLGPVSSLDPCKRVLFGVGKGEQERKVQLCNEKDEGRASEEIGSAARPVMHSGLPTLMNSLKEWELKIRSKITSHFRNGNPEWISLRILSLPSFLPSGLSVGREGILGDGAKNAAGLPHRRRRVKPF